VTYDKGQVFKMSHASRLVLMVVRLRYENGLDDKIRRKIILAGQKYGLLSETRKIHLIEAIEGARPTSKYFALMSDEASSWRVS